MASRYGEREREREKKKENKREREKKTGREKQSEAERGVESIWVVIDSGSLNNAPILTFGI